MPIRIAPFEKQKIKHLIFNYGGEISTKRRNIKGVISWDMFFIVDGKQFKGHGSIVDASENKSFDEIKCQLLNVTLGDFFNYIEHDFNKKRAILRTENIDRLKNYLNKKACHLRNRP